MSSVGMQIAALRAIAEKVTPRHLMKSGAFCRLPEAEHILDQVRQAIITLEKAHYDDKVIP